VADIHVIAELAADQDRTVTFQRVLFRTHQCQTKTSDTGLHALQTSAKCRRPRNEVVAGDAINVALTLGTARSEFVSKKNITDVCSPKRTIQNIPVELGKSGTVGTASHIADGFDPMPQQQFQELLPGLRRMADGEDLGFHGSKIVAQIL
jgi:hypothetical protein